MVLQGYGLTETSPVISVNTPQEYKFGSVGKPIPGVEVTILKESEDSASGEILTRGFHVMDGYFKSPEKTSEVMKDGWFRTGDIGYIDEEGFLHISGRRKNLIVLGSGKKVFPEEVEKIIGRSSYIKEMCVLGKRAERGLRKGHEEVYAVIVPEFGAFGEAPQRDHKKINKLIASEIARLGKNLADHKRIKGFEIRYEELPKTSTKKIKRKEIEELI
jgi:long-chain acyl-CoA synthetase